MRAYGVVILPPRLDNSSCLGQRGKSLSIQTLFPKPTIETFDVSVFRWFTGTDELQPYSPPMRPQVQCLTGKLRAVVGSDDCRALSQAVQPIQHPRYTLASQRMIHFDHRTTPVIEVNHGQHAKPAAVHQAVAHEIHGPVLIRTRGPRRHHPQMTYPLAAVLESERQPFPGTPARRACGSRRCLHGTIGSATVGCRSADVPRLGHAGRCAIRRRDLGWWPSEGPSVHLH